MITRFRWPLLLVMATGMLALACGDGSAGNEAAEAPDVGRGSSDVEVTSNEGPAAEVREASGVESEQSAEDVREETIAPSSATAEDERPSLSDDVARSIEEAAAAREEPFREGLRLFLVRVDRALAFPGEGFALPLFTPRVDHFANRVFSVTSDFQWSPDGQRIALSDSLGVWTVNAEDFGIGRVLDVPASALAWAPDSERLAVSTVDGVLMVDRRGEVLARIAQEPVEAMAFSPDGRSVAYVSDRRDLSPLWVWRDDETWQSPVDVYQFEWLGDGSLGVVSDDDEPIRVLRPFSGEVVVMPYAFDGGAPASGGGGFVAFSADGRRVAVDVANVDEDDRTFPPSTAEARVLVFDVASGEVVAMFEGVRLPRAAPFSPDGSRLALASSVGSRCEGGVEARAVIGSMDGSTVASEAGNWSWNRASFRWSPDGQVLALSTDFSPDFLLLGDPGGEAPVVVGTGAVRTGPYRWSPDGSMIAFLEVVGGTDCG